MQAVFVQEGCSIDYTPVSAVSAGQVVLVGTVPMVAKLDIAAGALGSLATEGVFAVAKKTGALTAGDACYWDVDADPVGGSAGTGAISGTAADGNLMGLAVADAASGDATVLVKITAAKRTTAIAGSVTADDIAASDATLTISGLQAAQGGSLTITGGTSTTSGNAGGAVAIVGGTPGATGAGGALSITAGAGGATSGTGGALTIAAGAGTNGNANGGALTIRGGAKNGSGANGAIAIGDANTASITMGVMPRIPVAAVAAAGNAQGNAAALSEGLNIVSGADDTKGVILPAAVAGMVVIVKSTVSNKILKVYPNTSDAVNALSADAAISLASGPTIATFYAADATTWYTHPLLPS